MLVLLNYGGTEQLKDFWLRQKEEGNKAELQGWRFPTSLGSESCLKLRYLFAIGYLSNDRQGLERTFLSAIYMRPKAQYFDTDVH